MEQPTLLGAPSGRKHELNECSFLKVLSEYFFQDLSPGKLWNFCLG